MAEPAELRFPRKAASAEAVQQQNGFSGACFAPREWVVLHVDRARHGMSMDSMWGSVNRVCQRR
jgi:hypothetical protein